MLLKMDYNKNTKKRILCIYAKKIDYFQKYGIILLVVSPTAKWTAKSVSNSNGVTTQMAMWKRIAIFYEEIYADRFQIIQGGYEIYP